MKLHCLIFLGFLVASAHSFLAAQNATQAATTADERTRRKRFSIFHVVQFQNSQCILAMSTPTNVMMGTCFTQSECTSNGGTVSGNCASGFGVCCMFSVSACGSTVSRNCTYIQNPGFPTSFTTAGSCMYNFQSTTDICQIRLDFNNFVLSNPNTGGQCLSTVVGATNVDGFRVNSASATGNLVPPVPGILCGTNTGNFLYFETGRQTAAGNIQITVGAGFPNQIRTWKIKVTFIECGNPNRAPTDCTQYFTGPGGTFMSYNYNGGAGQLTQNLNYNICFRQEVGYCTINYSEAGMFVNSAGKAFSLDVPIGVTTSIRGSLLGAMCANAGLIIPSLPAQAQTKANSEVYCGVYLNPLDGQKAAGVATGTLAPFVVGVYSNNNFPVGTSMGFNLMYEQIPC